MLTTIIGMAGSMWALAGKNYMSFKQGKEDAKTMQRISQWDRWFNEACAQRIKPADLIWNEQSTYGNHARNFSSISDWLNNDKDMNVALSLYLAQNPTLSISKNNCPNTTLYLIIGAAALVLILLFIFSNKK